MKHLRAEPETALKPVYLLKALGDPADRLSDGVVATFEEASTRAGAIQSLLRDLDQESLGDPQNGTYRLLGFLYSRPDYVLEPFSDWRHEKFYNYPIAGAFLENKGGLQAFAGLCERKLLAPVRLVDRPRHCPKCDGAHLNYIDVCPSCAQIDIVQQPFLHCFACGHVGPEEQFLSQHTLVCPKCMARLRHIGADYDRPLESYQCNACRHIFIEPQISAVCMHCRSISDPADLTPRPVYAWQLTEKGRISARTGDVNDLFSMIDELNNVSAAYFESILDWLLSLCRRHADEQFSLIGIRIRNVIELTDRIGRMRVRELMDEFAHRVRELIRMTDLTTRTNQHTLWLLLPKTDVSGNKTVLERILAIQSDDKTGLQIASTSFHAPSQMVAGEQARLLMARLEGEIVE